MDVPDLGVTWFHTYTSDDIIEVPGFTVSLPSIFSAGVYVQVGLTDNGDQLHLKVFSSYLIGQFNVTSIRLLLRARDDVAVSTRECHFQVPKTVIFKARQTAMLSLKANVDFDL